MYMYFKLTKHYMKIRCVFTHSIHSKDIENIPIMHNMRFSAPYLPRPSFPQTKLYNRILYTSSLAFIMNEFN